MFYLDFKPHRNRNNANKKPDLKISNRVLYPEKLDIIFFENQYYHKNLLQMIIKTLTNLCNCRYMLN